MLLQQTMASLKTPANVCGRWVAYEQENFRGRQYLWDMSERGEYSCCDKWCAQADHISSVRAVKQVGLSLRHHGNTSSAPVNTHKGFFFSSFFSGPQDNNAARAQLFERAGFSGKKMEIQDDIPNLMSRYSLNRVASIRVLGGA